MFKKIIILLLFINISNCSSFKKNKDEKDNFISSFSLVNIKNLIFSNNDDSSTNGHFENRKFSLHTPKIDESIKRNDLYDVDRKFNFNEIQEPDYSFLKNGEKNGLTIFKVDLENQQRKRLPFEEPENQTIINRKATLELGFKAKEDYVFFVKGNIADVNIDNSQRLSNQLNFNLNNQFDSVKFGILVNF